jgi:hypothetical protein
VIAAIGSWQLHVEHACEVSRKIRPLHGIAASTRVLDLPGLPAKGDVVDWARAQTGCSIVMFVDRLGVDMVQEGAAEMGFFAVRHSTALPCFAPHFSAKAPIAASVRTPIRSLEPWTSAAEPRIVHRQVVLLDLFDIASANM